MNQHRTCVIVLLQGAMRYGKMLHNKQQIPVGAMLFIRTDLRLPRSWTHPVAPLHRRG